MPENTSTPTNVQTLKTKLEAMSQPHRKTGKTNLWDVAVSINRTNAVPLDKSSVIFENAEDNTVIEAAAARETAYPGQIISGLKASDGKVYVLQPTGHEHPTHTSDAENNLIYTDQTEIVESVVYEELATQSTVDYRANKEAYERQVVNNARKNTETTIAEFILESSKNTEIQENGDIALSVPSQLSDKSITTTTTVLDYVVETVDAEKAAREVMGGDIISYLGTADANGFTIANNGNVSTLAVPNELSDKTKTPAETDTVLKYIEKTVEAEKKVREQATENLAAFIGTEVDIADNGTTILSNLALPEKLSDQTATTATTILDYIQQTVEAEVQKRYNQDLVLLACINNLDLHRVISATDESDPSKDGILTIDLTTKLRDNSADTSNPPLTKYNK